MQRLEGAACLAAALIEKNPQNFVTRFARKPQNKFPRFAEGDGRGRTWRSGVEIRSGPLSSGTHA